MRDFFLLLIYSTNLLAQESSISNYTNPKAQGTLLLQIRNDTIKYVCENLKVENGSVLLCIEPGYEYQWYLDGNPIDSAISQFLIPFQNGVYQVSTTDFHDCEVFSDYLSINTLSAGEDISKIMFYPNNIFII